MSRIALVEADWIGVQEGENLPDRFVVKISSLLAFSEMSLLLNQNDEHENKFNEEKLKGMDEMAKTMHNREVAAYRILMKERNSMIPIIEVSFVLNVATQRFLLLMIYAYRKIADIRSSII